MPVLRVPSGLKELSAEIYRRDNVQGVFYGQRYSPDGTWSDDLGLCLHVKQLPKSPPTVAMTALEGGLHGLVKRSRALSRQMLSRGRGEGRKMVLVPDAIEVGNIVTHLLDNDSRATAPGPRTGAVAALAPRTGGSFALLSGHVSLPIVNKKIAHAYSGTGAAAPVVAQQAALSVSGEVQFGRLGESGPHDWALAWFPDVASSGFHNAAGASTPDIPLRTNLPEAGEPVKIWSPKRGDFSMGHVRQISTSVVGAPLPDGTTADYVQVLVISPSDARNPNAHFSVPGDSGALIVDRVGRALGMVLGGSTASNLSYAVQLRFAARAFPALFRLFFSF